MLGVGRAKVRLIGPSSGSLLSLSTHVSMTVKKKERRKRNEEDVEGNEDEGRRRLGSTQRGQEVPSPSSPTG